MTIAAQSFVHHEPKPAIPMGLATLVKLAFEGVSLDPLWETLIRRGLDDPGDAAALMDLSTIAQVTGRRHERLVLQRHALEAQRHYRQLPADGSGDGIGCSHSWCPATFSPTPRLSSCWKART